MAIEWSDIEELFKKSSNKVELLTVKNKNTDIIEKLNINEQSVLGQMLINVNGVVINDYLTILGKDEGKENKGIISFNDRMKQYYQGNKLIVAYDVWGGIFSIGNGDFDGDIRKLWYYAPDLLQWECLDVNYAEFIAWVCSGNIKVFYKNFLWSNIDKMLEIIKSEEAILIYPFLWANECDIENANKKIVPFEEIVAINAEYEKKMN